MAEHKMQTNPSPFASAGIFGRYQDTDVQATLSTLRTHLESRGLEVYLGDTTASNIPGPRIEDSGKPLSDTIDLGIVIGGDGTMLHAARSLAPVGLPLIGVNLGRLGYLTDIPAGQMTQLIDELLAGQFTIEERIMLQVEVFADDQLAEHGVALNDVALVKGETGRMIEFETYVNGESVGRTRGDGMILSTPTGSTAYALSVGGPILHPLLPAILFAPVCPHSLGQRPLVLDDSSHIKIDIVDLAGAGANVFVDGIHRIAVAETDFLIVRRADIATRMIRINSHNHYTALRSKLGWG
jgi:NAD+ kinase